MTARTTFQRVGIGLVVYLLFLLLERPEITPAMLALAPLVLVPLGLRLLVFSSGPRDRILSIAAQLSVIPATTAALALMVDPGFGAFVLSLPWLLTTAALGFSGVRRFLSRERVLGADIALDGSLLMLAYGGLWFTTSRLGANPLDFSDHIVELAAIHFHFAGFALCAVTGVITWPRGGRIASAVPIGVVASVLLTTLGVQYGGRIEWIGSISLAVFGFAVGVLLVWEAESGLGLARVILRIAGVCLMVGMVAAAMWAWSERYGWDEVTLFRMLRAHGAVNAIGFGALGMLGLNLKLLERSRPEHGEVILRTGSGDVHASALAERGNALAMSYRFVGLTTEQGFDSELDEVPDGYRTLVRARSIGNAEDALDRAAQAMLAWRGHTGSGLRLAAPNLELEEGATVAFAKSVGPLSVIGASRVLAIVDEEDEFGFSYGTTSHHFADGEERFRATRDEDGYVTVEVAMVSRPARALTRLGGPVFRWAQERAVDRWIDAVAEGPVRGDDVIDLDDADATEDPDADDESVAADDAADSSTSAE